LSTETHDLNKDLREFVELLVGHEVEFVVVGAYALAFHGHPRYTQGIDFFVRSSQKNAEKLAKLIHEFCFASTGLKASEFYDPDVVVQLGNEPNRIDLITRIDGVTFDEVWEHKVPGDLGGTSVWFIALEDYLANKRAAGRPKDVADVAAIDPNIV
jgi:predicted nucleotidyltransferase